MFTYLPRVIDEELKLHLDAFGAVMISGPKWCGKTTTAEQHSKTIIRLQDPDKREGYLQTAKTKPSLLLKGEYPLLIDEWQDIPVIWDAVRVKVDQEKRDGLFILTGSTSANNINMTEVKHTGTGRISRLKMLPMSLYESNESNGKISLLELFDNPKYDIDGIKSELSIENLIFSSCRGGWPASLNKKSDKASLLIAKDYLNQICEYDISKIDNEQRNPMWTRIILQSYARNISTNVKKSVIYSDVRGNVDTLSLTTFDTYINALERLCVLDDLDAWSPALRSKTAIRAGKKREFIDPSIAVAALGVTPEGLEKDLKTFGFLFECLCIRDLKVYSSANGGNIFFYRDRYGLEVDAVLHLSDGRYALIEFKLGSSEIDVGAKHLIKIKNLISEYNKKEKQVPLRIPDILMVITGTDIAYTRPDGVRVVPIGCLKD